MIFDKAIKIVLEFEGGEVNDPRDPGGHTKYGISKRAFPEINIADLTLSQAINIYRFKYWNETEIERYPALLRLAVFDFCVNSGRGNAIRKLQSAIGVADDGIVGPITREKLQSLNPIEVLFRYNKERENFLRRLSTWPVYGNGWKARIDRVLMESCIDGLVVAESV